MLWSGLRGVPEVHRFVCRAAEGDEADEEVEVASEVREVLRR